MIRVAFCLGLLMSYWSALNLVLPLLKSDVAVIVAFIAAITVSMVTTAVLLIGKPHE